MGCGTVRTTQRPSLKKAEVPKEQISEPEAFPNMVDYDEAHSNKASIREKPKKEKEELEELGKNEELAAKNNNDEGTVKKQEDSPIAKPEVVTPLKEKSKTLPDSGLRKKNVAGYKLEPLKPLTKDGPQEIVPGILQFGPSDRNGSTKTKLESRIVTETDMTTEPKGIVKSKTNAGRKEDDEFKL